jgi:mRNA interferase RelE/StbE
MSFTVDLRLVQKTLDRMEQALRKRILHAANTLAHNPRQPGSRKLEGTTDMWRIRTGDYRIIYTIEDDRLVVLVVKIGYRREVYR